MTEPPTLASPFPPPTSPAVKMPIVYPCLFYRDAPAALAWLTCQAGTGSRGGEAGREASVGAERRPEWLGVGGVSGMRYSESADRTIVARQALVARTRTSPFCGWGFWG